MSSRVGPWLAVAALVCGGACGSPPRQAILITIDTLRDDHVGPRPLGGSLTPELDRLRSDGVRFTDTLTSATTTIASHASMLTGLRPTRHGLLGNDGVMDASIPTVAKLLRERGVRTGAVVSSFVLRSEQGGLAGGFEVYDESFDQHEQVRKGQRVKSPSTATRVALAWVREHRREPFFLWVHYFPPHGPYTPPEPFLSIADRKDAPGAPRRVLPLSAQNYERGTIPKYQQLEGLSDPEEYRRRYEAQVRYVDHHVGVLLAGLRELGVYDRAFVIATADHGESLGEHDWYFCHGNLVYQDQARVPLLVKWPRSQGIAGRQSSAAVELVDVMPTLLQFFGLPPAPGVDGEDLAPLAEGTRAASDRLRITQSTDGELTAVVLGPMKLIELRGSPRLVEKGHARRELFRLDRDAAEAHDLTASEPALVRRLTGLLPRCRGPARRQGLSDEAQEQLTTLGYVVRGDPAGPCDVEPAATPHAR